MSIINNPAISVIIPVYNIEDYVSNCLQSVVSQDFSNIEIIVVNDSSTDNSLKIVEDFASKDPRIIIINTNKNSGLSAVRNIGLKKAKGQFIHFLDGDDYIAPYTYSELFEYALLNQLDMLLFAHFRTRKGKTKVHNFNKKLRSYNKRIFSTVQDKQFLLNVKLGVTAWNRLFKKDFLLKNNLFFKEGVIFEDVLFYWQTIVAAGSISFLNIPFYYYCQRESGSIMSDIDAREDLDIIKIMDEAYNYLVKRNQIANYAEVFSDKLLKTYVSFFKGIKKQQKKEFFIKMQRSLNNMTLSPYIKNKLLQRKLTTLKKSSLVMLNLLAATKLIR